MEETESKFHKESDEFNESLSTPTISSDYNPTLIIQEHSPEPELPFIRGWLQKRSTHLIKRWQNRYFVLRNKILSYYGTESDENPRTTIDFDQVSVSLEFIKNKNPQEMTLSIVGCKRAFKLRAMNGENLEEWVENLYLHINSSRGSKSDLYLISSKEEFWRYARISNEKFSQEADIGDVLLFKSKNLSAKLQRGVTLSKYDHVAMLLRWKDGVVGMLEATGQTGVQILLWSDFIRFNWHLLYTRLVYRKLEIKRTDEMLEKLEKFLENVEGKRYSLNPTKIFKKRSPGEEENFFCSELVASAYKAIGVLSEDEKSSSYLPLHFSSKKQIPLIDSNLSQEYLIDFQL
ncbi:hypothetical protein SteCoe_31194 [Stentor coeruleus]|uniref:PH domain-containing protein n=1 Tax=Stentor coeruleus TaxID=5963 RepID=A0A1R2B226_9CILI|nr:hypothetical protein SteCoe_31194 [Stentor coeruleus]